MVKIATFAKPQTVIGNSICDRATIKRQDIEQTFKTTINNMTGLLTNRQTLQEKIKKTPPHEKNNLNFYGNRTSGTFAFAATLQVDPKAKSKEPLFPTLYFRKLEVQF